MKKLIIILLSTLLLGSPLAAEQNIRQESVELFTSKGIDANKSPTLNVAEATIGCKLTQFSYEYNQVGLPVVGEYECKGEDNYFKDLANKLDTPIAHFVAILLLIYFFINAILAGFELLISLSSSNVRKNNAWKTFATKLLKLIMVATIVPIISILVIGSMMISTGIGEKIANTQKFNQGTNFIPELSSKNFRIESLLNYLICVKTVAADSSQIADIRIFETVSQGLEIKANYSYCELSGSISLDTKGIEIAKHYDLFDYKQKQQEAAIAALQKLIVRLDQIADKIANSGNDSFGFGNFPEYVEGEQLYTLDVSGYDEIEINKFKAKAIDYLSRDFIFQLNKTPDITQSKIEEQVKTLNHRRINICSADELNPNHRISLEEIRSKLKQCVSRNCSDISGSSSPYACSIALEKFHAINGDTTKDFVFLPAMRVLNKSSDYQSAKLMTGSINFQFFITDDISYRVDMNKRLDSIKVSTNLGVLEKGKFIDVLEAGENLKIEKASEEDISSEILGYFTTDEGFLSFDRFFTCLANPHKTVGTFQCKNFEYEFEKQSLVLTFTALKLQTAKALYTNPWSFKKKGSVGGADYSKAASKIDLEVLAKVIDKRQLALLTPLLFDTYGEVLFEDVYGENYHTMVGDNGTFYALLALMASSKAGEEAISFIAGTMHFVAQTLMYGHIIIPVVIFLLWFTTYLIDILFQKYLIQFSLVMQISMNGTSRKDLDKENWYILLEAFAMKPILFTIGFFIVIALFRQLLIGIGDLRDFTSLIFRTDYRESIPNNILIISLSIFLLFTFYIMMTAFMKFIVEIGLNYAHGKGSDNDNRIQSTDEFREVSKKLKGKEL